jgi:hypothetical protein
MKERFTPSQADLKRLINALRTAETQDYPESARQIEQLSDALFLAGVEHLTPHVLRPIVKYAIEEGLIIQTNKRVGTDQEYAYVLSTTHRARAGKFGGRS